MLDFDDIKIEFESQGFRCSHVGISTERDKSVMFMESTANTEYDILSVLSAIRAHDGWTKWFEAAKESGIPALVKFANQKECRIPGLAAHAAFPISTGKQEGFNNKTKVAKRIGYGYRDEDFFFTLIRYLFLPHSFLHGNP